MTSGEHARLFYFLDALGGAPDQFSGLLRMEDNRESSDDYRQAIGYIRRLVESAKLVVGDNADLRAFHARLAQELMADIKNVRVERLSPAQAEAREALRRAML
jgi:hypothetical protein